MANTAPQFPAPTPSPPILFFFPLMMADPVNPHSGGGCAVSTNALNASVSFQLKMILIKCCDISNEVRPMEVAEPWVDCLLEEYFMQSDREKSEGLPVAPFMDRDKVTKATAQIGFIKFVLIPMFETVTKLFPVVEETMLRPLWESREHYEELKQLDDAMKELQKKTESLTSGAPENTTEKNRDAKDSEGHSPPN